MPRIEPYCPYCDRRFPSMAAVWAHIQQEHPEHAGPTPPEFGGTPDPWNIPPQGPGFGTTQQGPAGTWGPRLESTATSDFGLPSYPGQYGEPFAEEYREDERTWDAYEPTEEERFLCPYCGAGFIGRDLFQEHLLAYHPDEPSPSDEDARVRGPEELTAAEIAALEDPDGDGDDVLDPTRHPTVDPPTGYQWVWRDYVGYVLEPDPNTMPTDLSPFQKAQLEAQAREAEREWAYRLSEQHVGRQETEKEWAYRLAEQHRRKQEFEQQQAATQEWRQWQIEQEERELGATQDWRQWQIEEAGRQADIEQQNYLARLAAQPRSWLEYSAAAGETPAIQPWMAPLMPQQYGMTQAGQAIPGWGTENMTGMPELLRPARQYQARMTPSSRQQYQGYEQARTGATPEDIEWRLWSTAPPAGGGSRLARVR